jgi:transcriptional regulator with XRE-family HTH domain/Zn-dependent peptidase ImmA (M78 family)
MLNENEIVKLVFGLKVRTLRQAKGLSYQQLASETGIAVSYLHDIENGKKYPKANKILALAKVLEVDYDYLVSLNAGKKLQPVIQLLTSDLMNVVPWEHFGISIPFLLSLFVNTPDKVTAFISTLIKIFRTYELSRERFYTTALRSYQELNDNYFSDLEDAVVRFRKEFHIPASTVPDNEKLKEILKDKYGVSIDYKKMRQSKVLSDIRTFYAKDKGVLFINKLQPSQELFSLAREVAFHYLALNVRPYESIMLQPASFDVVLNNFMASYFAAALIIPEDSLVEDLSYLFAQEKWQPDLWLGVFRKYHATEEMIFQRLTNILPHHFGIDQLFFLRLNLDNKGNYSLTKELHLSHLHDPHANSLHENYCRRWLAIRALNKVSDLSVQKKLKDRYIDVQISNYWQTVNNYVLISMAKPRQNGSPESVSITVGLYIDPHLQKLMPMLSDKKIPHYTVHTTCERCSITNCNERAAEPLIVETAEFNKSVEEALNTLGGNGK